MHQYTCECKTSVHTLLCQFKMNVPSASVQEAGIQGVHAMQGDQSDAVIKYGSLQSRRQRGCLLTSAMVIRRVGGIVSSFRCCHNRHGEQSRFGREFISGPCLLQITRGKNKTWLMRAI